MLGFTRSLNQVKKTVEIMGSDFETSPFPPFGGILMTKLRDEAKDAQMVTNPFIFAEITQNLEQLVMKVPKKKKMRKRSNAKEIIEDESSEKDDDDEVGLRREHIGQTSIFTLYLVLPRMKMRKIENTPCVSLKQTANGGEFYYEVKITDILRIPNLTEVKELYEIRVGFSTVSTNLDCLGVRLWDQANPNKKHWTG